MRCPFCHGVIILLHRATDLFLRIITPWQNGHRTVNHFEARAIEGRLELARYRQDWQAEAASHSIIVPGVTIGSRASRKLSSLFFEVIPDRMKRTLGFGRRNSSTSGQSNFGEQGWVGWTDVEHVVSIPLAAPLIIAAVGPTLILVRRHRRRLARKGGYAAKCGYDLRQTPERCPECGMKV